MRVLELDERTIRDSVDYLCGRSKRRPREYAAGRVSFSATRREFCSYGWHFPLAHYVPRHTFGRNPAVWIINGDEWRGPNSRTRDHQTYTRQAIAETGIPALVLPFSALDGAGIVLDSIRPVHIRPDANWTETRYSEVLSDVPRTMREIPYRVTRAVGRLEDLPRHIGPKEWREPTAREARERVRRFEDSTGASASVSSIPNYFSRMDYLPRLPDTDGRYRWTETRYRPRKRGADGRYEWQVNVHRLGDSLFSAVRETRSREGGFTRTARARFLSSFDTNESPPLYFLAQVPRGAGDTVESALDALAPRAVHAARARGRAVYRQGDIFYLETDHTRESLALNGARFARLTLWTRDAAPRADEVTGAPRESAKARRARAERAARYRRRVWRESFRDYQTRAETAPAARPRSDSGARADCRRRVIHAEEALAKSRAYMRRIVLAGPAPRRMGADYQRWNGSRYLSNLEARRFEHKEACENARRNYGRALAALESAKQARVMARDTYRSVGGAARTAWTIAGTTARERFYPETRMDRIVTRRARVRRACSIYGTAHSATEVAILRGAVYARGVARHVPALDETRSRWDTAPDHRPFTLGDGTGWYLALRNRVPRDS